MQDGQNNELEERLDALSEQREGVWHCLQCGRKDRSWVKLSPTLHVGHSLSILNRRSKFHLRRHAELHIEGFSHPCQFCEKEFPHRAALKNHKLKAHPEHKVVKPFNCDLCDQASTSLIGLEAHKKRMHKM